MGPRAITAPRFRHSNCTTVKGKVQEAGEGQSLQLHVEIAADKKVCYIDLEHERGRSRRAIDLAISARAHYGDPVKEYTCPG